MILIKIDGAIGWCDQCYNPDHNKLYLINLLHLFSLLLEQIEPSHFDYILIYKFPSLWTFHFSHLRNFICVIGMKLHSNIIKSASIESADAVELSTHDRYACMSHGYKYAFIC